MVWHDKMLLVHWQQTFNTIFVRLIAKPRKCLKTVATLQKQFYLEQKIFLPHQKSYSEFFKVRKWNKNWFKIFCNLSVKMFLCFFLSSNQSSGLIGYQRCDAEAQKASRSISAIVSKEDLLLFLDGQHMCLLRQQLRIQTVHLSQTLYFESLLNSQFQ